MHATTSIRQIIVLSFCLLLSFSSCKIATEKESAAIGKIASFWGASVSYGVSVGTSTSEGSYHTFTLTIKDCAPVDDGSIDPEYVANSAAWMMYSNWNAEERKKFTNVNVTIEKGQSQKAEYSIPLKTLAIVSDKLTYLRQAVDELKQKNTDAFIAHLDTTVFDGYNRDTMNKILSKIDSLGGPILTDTVFSYQFIPAQIKDKQVTLLKLGTLITNNHHLRFSIVADTSVDISGPCIKGLNYKLIKS